MPKTAWLTLGDHAFASGPVFRRPSSYLAALKRTQSISGARLLMAVWSQFDGQAETHNTVHLGMNARLINRNAKSNVTIGNDCAIRAVIRVESGGYLDIGNSTYAGDNCLISVFDRVTIGAGTLLAHGVQIFDNNSHPIDAHDRVADFRKKLGYKLDREIQIDRRPVRIGARCWLGLNVIVMKGVTIGDDTIVAAGSVVVSDLPSGVLAAGNPARPIKSLLPADGVGLSPDFRNVQTSHAD